MKYLLISEKPSLMRLVQTAYYKAHMNFEVDFMSLHGHCCTLCSPGEYKEEWNKWSLDQLPMIPDVFKHKPVDDKLVKDIQKQLKTTKYDGFINCTDSEREGQNIFYSLYDYLGSNLPVKRFWSSDLTDEKLIDAWKNLKDDKNDTYLKNLTAASLLRAESDWLVGMNFSRMVSIINGKNIPVGRVMTVVHNILSEREEAIKNFKPKTSYKVMVDYKDGFSGELQHDLFENKSEAESVLKEIPNKIKVQSFESKTRNVEAPLLYSLGELQNDANKQYGYSLSDSLAIIQKLYEAKILSYPRTDCPYLTTGEGARMKYIVAACKCVPSVEGIKIDEKRIAGYTKTKYVNDKKIQAHYAIVFTGKEFDFNNLSQEQQNICTLVAKRIVATLLDPAQMTDITVRTSTNDKDFITKESILTYVGWKILYGEKAGNVSIKNIVKGQELEIVKSYIKDVVTKCPPRFTDASLNSAMINVGTLIEDKELASALTGKTKEQGGIGTPATRAPIVEKLLDDKKGWVKRVNGKFQVTEQGLYVYHALKDYSISSPILTAQWEQKLKQIEEGKYNPRQYSKELNDYIISECDKLKTVKVEGSLLCPCCNSPLKESEKYYYCTKYKNGCDFIISKKIAGTNISRKDMEDIINSGSSEVKTFTSKEGKKFNAKLVFKDNKIAFELANNPKNAIKIICSCGKNIQYLDGKFGKFYKCDCGKIVSENFCGHKFTKSEIKKLFEDKTVLVENLTSKAGKNFSANLKIDNNKVKIESFEGAKK